MKQRSKPLLVSLSATLALALAALDKLFGIDVDEKNYPRLWCLIAFVFNTWYFLGGVPRWLGELERTSEYPQVLKVFSQFILVPLVLLYLLILTAYLGRVAITREWPSGWIWSTPTSPASRTGKRAWPVICPGVSSRCWSSAGP